MLQPVDHLIRLALCHVAVLASSQSARTLPDFAGAAGRAEWRYAVAASPQVDDANYAFERKERLRTLPRMDDVRSQGHFGRAAQLSTLAFAGQGLFYLLTVVLARRLGVDGFEAYSVAVAAVVLLASFATWGLEKYAMRVLPSPLRARRLGACEGIPALRSAPHPLDLAAGGHGAGGRLDLVGDRHPGGRSAGRRCGLPGASGRGARPVRRRGAERHRPRDSGDGHLPGRDSGRGTRPRRLGAVPAVRDRRRHGRGLLGPRMGAWPRNDGDRDPAHHAALPSGAAAPQVEARTWQREALPFVAYSLSLTFIGQAGVIALDRLQPSAAAVGAYAVCNGDGEPGGRPRHRHEPLLRASPLDAARTTGLCVDSSSAPRTPSAGCYPRWRCFSPWSSASGARSSRSSAPNSWTRASWRSPSSRPQPRSRSLFSLSRLRT